MPLGFERLNERTQRPNALINFIRTIPGPSSSTAENILNRVAAVCYPFMKSNMILVQALEEFPYNNEFVGRNFNAGEVIQLVLRDRNGRWLPQRMVEMVMVHELAHCKQMNHSKAFWTVRDEYAVDLRALWAKGYTGEGMWGRGRGLETGAVQMNEADIADIPEHLCGGTYGRRSRKRKRGGKDKPTLSYAERKQRRIQKKFGVNGQALGADEETKVKLEGGAPKKGKPRVAGSARGRELRAAAALARFEPVKKEDDEVSIKKEDSPSDSETEDEIDKDDAALDYDGKKMTDDQGRFLIKICDEEDDQDGNARREFDEIQGIRPAKSRGRELPTSKGAPVRDRPIKSKSGTTASSKPAKQSTPAAAVHLDELWKRRPKAPKVESSENAKETDSNTTSICAICSLENEADALTCMACSNVLKPDFEPGHWQCGSAACEGSKYINSGDSGSCGVCGTRRSSV
ncbi:WLM domain-containing protein [Paraphoma chrysanthemicola]|uniref:WLM domain-containing protein n=1 Tax=Paraphoma chrysanthemicola TaxID=798071 RepID=A0A8K0W457_9PLEO|nr:WLM domain-containing protein [Paraphoma chrysanthemicola]